jgi:hypothetical protein
MEEATEGTPADRGSGRITARDLARVRRAAIVASSTLPGAIGEIVARELRAYADFGYRFGADSLLDQATAELLDSRNPPSGPIAVQRPAS